MQHNRKKRMIRILFSLMFLCMFSGCKSSADETETAAEKEVEKKVGGYVEKEVMEEADAFTDNESLYADDDDTSVVTMYLTVCTGNAGDHTDHTWAEINKYSTYDYEELGVERYNVDVILQIGDENGVVGSEFGSEVTVPNAAVQVRGQTSSKLKQKNYKIRIKEGKGEWRGQRTLALNKHVSDPIRFRNKFAYDMMKEIPQMMSARTQFVHLYVKDEASGSKTFVDYGLYTQVEQINKTYLKNHGLDNKGNLYKINFFEWAPYDAVMKLKTDPDYDEEAFEEYIEIKGNDDHSKLQEVILKLQDYSIPIDDILEQHFDVENLCYWMAFHILIGNYDVGSRNSYIYSPLNSEKWYIISWDNDSSLARTYHAGRNYSEGESWERGMTQFVHIILYNRMFREEKYRKALDDAITDLKNNYLTKEAVNKKAQAYAAVVKPYAFSKPDVEELPVDEAGYDKLIQTLASEIDKNYQYYLEGLEKPWPFFVGVPEKAGGKWEILWDVSYDPDDEDITYSFTLASDYEFKDVIVHEEDIHIPQMTIDPLPEGQYFIRVQARNASGYVQDCFDYYPVEGVGKVYGCKSIFVNADGTVTDDEVTE